MVCPSEVWPTEVDFRQDDPNYPHRVWMQVTKQECSGTMISPDPSECGEGVLGEQALTARSGLR